MMNKKFVRVLVLLGDKALVMKSSYKGREIWNLPGGKLEENETIDTSAKREVFEECGIYIDQLTIFYENSFLIQGVLWDGIYLFTKNFKGEPFIQEPHKCSEMGFKSFSEIAKLPSINELLIEPLKLIML